MLSCVLNRRGLRFCLSRPSSGTTHSRLYTGKNSQSSATSVPTRACKAEAFPMVGAARAQSTVHPRSPQADAGQNATKAEYPKNLGESMEM